MPLPAHAQTYKPLTQAERQVCGDLERCTELLLTYGPNEFDYGVLAAEFRRFGPNGKGGASKLIDLAGGGGKGASRAQAVLAQKGWFFDPQSQSAIGRLWPSASPQRQADIMIAIGSPMMRNFAVMSLADKDEDIRDNAQRILHSIKDRPDFPLPPRAFPVLAKAATMEPSEMVLTMIGRYPPAQSRPVLQRVLKSEDYAAVRQAYDQLYAQDPKTAFQSLIATLKSLKDSDVKTSFALAAILTQRHKKRSDGFYMTFAKGLAEDTEMPAAARVAGLHAVMSQSDVTLDLQETLIPLTLALGGHDDVPFSYSDYLSAQTGALPDGWIKAFDAAYRKTTPSRSYGGYASFIALMGAQESGLAKSIVAKALKNRTDYNVQMAAMLASAKQGRDISPMLAQLKTTHPISVVRLAAEKGLAEIKSPTDNTALNMYRSLHPFRLGDALAQLNNSARYCSVKAFDFEEKAQQLPFFPPGKMGPYKASRNHLSSAVALKDGWLAGYDYGEFAGALIYYDYASEGAKNLLDENVMAIVPTRKTPLGQYAPDHWVVTGLDHMGTHYGHIYRVNKNAGGGFDARFHAALPGRPAKIDVLADQSLVFGFGSNVNADKRRFNPPLRLSPNGAIGRACENPAQRKSKRGASPKALPN